MTTAMEGIVEIKRDKQINNRVYLYLRLTQLVNMTIALAFTLSLST